MSDTAKNYKNLQLHHEAAKKEIPALKKELKGAEQQLRMHQDPQFLADDQRKQALQVKFACGTTGYELLRTIGYPLPSTRTLMRRMQSFVFLPGIFQEVFNVLNKKADTMHKSERDCVLFLDEMKIDESIQHDQAQDYFLGSIPLPSRNDVAHRALVFMLGGVTSRWKQIVAYHFTGRSLDGELLKVFVLKLVQLASEAELNVLVVTCDMGQLPPEAESTAWFCELVSRWFTLVSSRHPVVALSHLDLQQPQTAIRTLDLTFGQMKMGVTAYWKPLQAGVISSTTVVYPFQEDLLNEHGYAYLLTAVEEDIMDDFLVMMTKEEGHILAYVGGLLVRAVMRTMNCNTCKRALTSDSNREYSTLIRLKEYVRESENLTYPSHAVMQFVTACEEQFKGLTYTTEILNLASPFKTIAAVLRKNNSLVSKACSAHKDNVERRLLDKYLYFRLNIYLKQACLEKRASGHSSNTCAGVNLL
ncbi:hypothetical protein HPB47_004232 [Ixodes persulcatus]|uniref:Uncharacterized protein n=1 Tax=Ixodes persulcatus TaxID=34615 RepID=A0AC60PGJ5_IXOPE|nr:hypothetical protein HPB47_004232 [Ixodes persulcatus]